MARVLGSVPGAAVKRSLGPLVQTPHLSDFGCMLRNKCLCARRRRKCETVGSKSRGSAHLHWHTVVSCSFPLGCLEGRLGMAGRVLCGQGSHVGIACC